MNSTTYSRNRRDFVLGITPKVAPFLLAVCLIFAAAAGSGAAGTSPEEPSRSAGKMPEFQVLRSDDSGVSFLFELQDLSIEQISLVGTDFHLIAIPGGELAGGIGSPALPTFTRLVAVPNNVGVSLSVTSEEEELLSGYRVAPMQALDGEVVAYDLAAYSRDNFGSVPLAKEGAPAVLRDLRVIPITFHPVQCNPAEGILKISRRFRVDIEFAGVDLRNASPSRDRLITPSFDNLYRSVIINYEEPDQSLIQPGTYMIIYPNLSGVESRLQPLADWRDRKGTPVIMVSTAVTGTSTTSIKNYIQSVYNSSDPPLEYVCLAGDANGTYAIPTFTENLSGYGGEGDHPYTQLDGGDILADVHIGRLTFGDLSKIEMIVEKMVGYESTPYMDETDWYTRGCVCGDWDTQTGWSAVYVNQWVKTALLRNNYTEVDTIWYEPYVSGMVQKLNRGDTVFSYRGWWGMSGWSNSNAYTLTNSWKMPFCVNITCDTGSFASGTAFSEGFLLAGSVGAPRGGIGSIGTATTGTHTRYNNCMHYGIFQGLLYDNMYEMGAALSRGKMEMYLNYQAHDANHVTIWSYWNNLMGDPAGEVWTAVPRLMSVSYPANVTQGTNSFTVTVSDGPLPVSGALVCLKRAGSIYETGYTNASGEVELPITAASNGAVLVTATKHNYQPHLGSFNIIDAAMMVGLQSSNIDDDTSGTSSGNNDGVVNPGESIELSVQLKNFGFISASAVEAQLTTNDPNVTFTDAFESFGTIGGGASAWSLDDFDFTVASGCPDGHIIRFSLEVSSGANHWHSMLELEVTSSALVTQGITLYNVGNSVLDPGETGQLSIALKNEGGSAATGVTANLISLSPMVSVLDASAGYGTINVGSTVENTGDRFEVSADGNTYAGYQASLLVVASFSGGRQDTAFVTLTVGTRSSDDPIGPDGYGYWAFDNTDTSYPEAPTYNWIEIDPAYGGSGTALNLNDSGEYDDKTVTVNLPFNFTYYGTSYPRASVCSNGWMSMGSTYLVNYRNWTIPGAGSPNAMIAPFWDDLYSTNNKIIQWHDSANHRYIVEWSRVRNLSGGNTETFQVILYDPAYYPTDTGDGEIVFQYETIANVDSGDNYATVGIENYNHTGGLLYSFWNDYPAGAAPLTSGRAIRFLPVQASPTGTVTGTIRNDLNNNPIQNASVMIVEEGDTFVTGADGTYSGNTAPGTYTVIASHPSFEPDTAYNVAVVEGEQVQVDFYLTDIAGPLLTTTLHTDTSDPNGPYVIPVTIEEYSGLTEATLYYRTEGTSFESAPLAHQTGNEYVGEIPGQAYGTYVEYYIYARDALGLESTDPTGAPGDTYAFFVIQTIQLFFDDMEADQGWTVGAAGDDATTGIWERVDPNGTYNGADEIQPEDDHTPAPGVTCFVTGNAAVGGGQGDNDVDGGTTTLISPIIDLSGQIGEITLTYYRWYSNDSGSTTNDSWVAVITDDGSQWHYLENLSTSDRNWTLMEFNLGDYIDFTNQVQIRFIASDLGDGGIVEAGIDDVEITIFGTAGAPDIQLPGETFALYQNTPNPASSSTMIRFALGADGPVKLVVYDIQGRVLRHLIDGPRTAGLQSVLWDGMDGLGNKVPSGIYFYRLQAGATSDTRKMIFLK
ncbi:MAG: carboxypeptidase regulatory-like domain-containing protein [Candidatus Eisenbacteria bacterium]|uniref:Carboxypeptidase regulatory-like domain-containing protein n=1 Tax=Eiseniibacteriota bacterium TaxID=2212470 RepID=A0A948RXK6_UNCEI|nr:carboxypeptidase regulatory-like domain-containing protein [Candidatus Eisenbacteria bacterium]MBU2692346.1 carboxypeptidase regulatory-like domain-containing protein [Candidatus Eisenbacteria bacterium]